MASGVRLREDCDAAGLRELAKRSRHPRQSRRLVAFAAVYAADLGRLGSAPSLR